MLYLEGSTDLAILAALAEVLDHPVEEQLKRPFVEYIGNQMSAASAHFHGLREAKPDLVAFALLDRQANPPEAGHPNLRLHVWLRREIENEIEQAIRTLGRSPWSDDVKASDDFLDPLFERFFRRLNLPNLLRKSDYHELAAFVKPSDLDSEVGHVLDMINDVATAAAPRR